jgi:hypothetical protein
MLLKGFSSYDIVTYTYNIKTPEPDFKFKKEFSFFYAKEENISVLN